MSHTIKVLILLAIMVPIGFFLLAPDTSPMKIMDEDDHRILKRVKRFFLPILVICRNPGIIEPPIDPGEPPPPDYEGGDPAGEDPAGDGGAGAEEPPPEGRLRLRPNHSARAQGQRNLRYIVVPRFALFRRQPTSGRQSTGSQRQKANQSSSSSPATRQRSNSNSQKSRTKTANNRNPQSNSSSSRLESSSSQRQRSASNSNRQRQPTTSRRPATRAAQNSKQSKTQSQRSTKRTNSSTGNRDRIVAASTSRPQKNSSTSTPSKQPPGRKVPARSAVGSVG